MDSFLSGSVQSWLAVVVAPLGPLIALIVGFEGADWSLRRLLSERTQVPPVEADDGKGEATSAGLRWNTPRTTRLAPGRLNPTHSPARSRSGRLARSAQGSGPRV
jgi:hypothetical protein